MGNLFSKDDDEVVTSSTSTASTSASSSSSSSSSAAASSASASSSHAAVAFTASSASSSSSAAAPVLVVPQEEKSSILASLLDRNKTFKPKKNMKHGTKKHTLHQTMKASMKATLGGLGDMRTSVQTPQGEDEKEWLAVNTVHFFNAASMVYGTCAEFCTDETCPVMCAGPNEYLWMDNIKYKKPTKMSAPQYISVMFDWIDEQLNDPNIFPVEDDIPFPRDFKQRVGNILKRVFRLYAHVYLAHFSKCQALGAEAHLNSCFKHLVYFVKCHNLVDEKEMEPMSKLITKFMEEDPKK